MAGSKIAQKTLLVRFFQRGSLVTNCFSSAIWFSDLRSVLLPKIFRLRDKKRSLVGPLLPFAYLSIALRFALLSHLACSLLCATVTL
eukprot:scaffold1368_cov72-Skeletonema_marinoi.AAC.5